MMEDKYFRLLCRKLSVGSPRNGIVFEKGKEYKTANFEPGIIRRLRQAYYTPGVDPVPAVEFYGTSKAKTKGVKKDA